jgi:hypothetical protein
MRRFLLLAVIAGCGPKPEAEPASWANFQCNDRKAAYFVVGSMSGKESGVELDCDKSGPRISRYVVDKGGTKAEDARAITPGEFDASWTRIDGAGWRNLGDCSGDKGKNIPVYQFDISDDEGKASFECDALHPGFPYDSIVQELDDLAATIQGDVGRATGD